MADHCHRNKELQFKNYDWLGTVKLQIEQTYKKAMYVTQHGLTQSIDKSSGHFGNDSPTLHGLWWVHTHPFNGPISGTTRVSRYQKGKTSLDFTEARDGEWQWHQLGHMQVCISLQRDDHTSTPPLSFYRSDALPAAQPTASKHWRQKHWRQMDYDG